ncbi:glycerophosphodiester phosphodiesterase [Actinokineospora sp. PR83]|uniref:glycerophosphodiester phosphodiesterase family protein n=1 Tax=Actinokineospora sp. PR83 TaxID=2884908 RepID=UPI0027DEC4F7|nr:glycerophosphodiester phosphodiesterase family protein [Actinokineospora sp. PR83]MCG8915665.1 glycerophosphodiester phosphodiesterase [Actinokineospora sp. PR83]
MSAPPWLTASPIAHRGLYDAENPENSLAAFGRAVARGVPFEFDVQVSRDWQPFVVHDRDLSRVVGRPTAPIAELDASEVREMRVAVGGLPVPTLEDVLALVDGTVPVVVDVRRWGFAADDRLENAVAERIRGYGGEFVLQSFDPVAVHRLRARVPDRAVGQVSGSLPSAGAVKRLLGRAMLTNAVTHPDFITYELGELPSRAVTFWRGRGRPVIAYSAHSPEDERRAAELADNVFFSGYLPDAYREPG